MHDAYNTSSALCLRVAAIHVRCMIYTVRTLSFTDCSLFSVDRTYTKAYLPPCDNNNNNNNSATAAAAATNNINTHANPQTHPST